jgi:glycosyltransferase involved in cell wall biosynthesis
MAPKVTVYVLTYQQRAFLRESLDSILAQDYPNVEIFVGDDASTDGTAEMIGEYERAHPGIVTGVIALQNGGITANSNRLLKHGDGEYAAWVAGDDAWLPGKLSAQVAWLEANPGDVLCYTNTAIFDSDSGRTLRLQHGRFRNRFRSGGMEEMFRSATFFVSSSVMCRRSAIPPHGFDSRLRMVSDWLMWVDIASKGRVGYVEGVLTRYRVHGTNTMKRLDMVLAEQLKAIDIAESRYPQYAKLARRIRADFLFGSGVERLRSGDAERATREFAESVRARPAGSASAPFPLNIFAVAAGRLHLLPAAWRAWRSVRRLLRA